MVVTDGLHRVTGDLTPDATGDYLPHIMHNGKMSYRRNDGAWFIWWNGVTKWRITAELGVVAAPYWEREDPAIEGEYPNGPGAEGIATVAEV